MERENEMETGEYIGTILGFMFRSCWDNGKENGNYYKGSYRGYKKSHNKGGALQGLGLGVQGLGFMVEGVGYSLFPSWN